MSHWKKKRKKKFTKNSNWSISRKLKNENRNSDEFEIMLNNLTLEEIIALKLELSSRYLRGKLYGFKIEQVIKKIAKDACVRWALSATDNTAEAAMILGISRLQLVNYRNYHKIEKFFVDKEEDSGYNINTQLTGSY